ncbi:hypothetical protein D3C76_880600 [compost metagenome]
MDTLEEAVEPVAQLILHLCKHTLDKVAAADHHTLKIFQILPKDQELNHLRIQMVQLFMDIQVMALQEFLVEIMVILMNQI